MRTIDTKPGTRVELQTPELLFLGLSGQPYRGTVYIKFVTAKTTVNLLDLKKYITSLRQVKIAAEDIAQYIFEHFNNTCMALGVIVDLTARGGIQQTIEYGKEFDPLRHKNNIFQI